MERNIRSLTEEMKNYYLQITKADKDDSLTSIQKENYRVSIKKTLESKGIKYFISIDDDIMIGGDYSRICFQSPPWQVNDVGIINDVHPKGSFPFSISIGDDISINYDPRKLKENESYNWNSLTNNEFLNFQKGDEFRFKGKISFCDYYFESKRPAETFRFSIIGEASIPKDYCFIATACYENYNAPEVFVLRQFRDEKLLKNSFGKVFVKFYYSVSPFFATIISKSELLKKSVRQYFLEPIVAELQRQNKSK